MQKYIILSKISPEAFESGKNFLELSTMVSETIKRECPGVIWKYSYVTMGRYDVIDIVEAESLEEVEKASMVIRSVGRASTETLPATPWNQFLKSLF